MRKSRFTEQQIVAIYTRVSTLEQAQSGLGLADQLGEAKPVVIGPKNRVHIFNDNALHVTSVVYQGETIRQLADAWDNGL